MLSTRRSFGNSVRGSEPSDVTTTVFDSHASRRREIHAGFDSDNGTRFQGTHGHLRQPGGARVISTPTPWPVPCTKRSAHPASAIASRHALSTAARARHRRVPRHGPPTDSRARHSQLCRVGTRSHRHSPSGHVGGRGSRPSTMHPKSMTTSSPRSIARAIRHTCLLFGHVGARPRCQAVAARAAPTHLDLEVEQSHIRVGPSAEDVGETHRAGVVAIPAHPARIRATSPAPSPGGAA